MAQPSIAETGGASLSLREGPSEIRVTSIVDLPNISPEIAQRLARLLPSARMGQDAHPDLMSIDVGEKIVVHRPNSAAQ